MATTLEISKIRTDGGTQPRAAIDFAAVDDYMEAMKDGVKFPPVAVFYDGSDYWLADGFHRCKAAFGAGLDEIACEIHQGTREDAQWFSFSANKANGLRRTNEDKQRAVKAALAHPKSGKMSDNAIARHVGVAQSTVSDWRQRIAPALKESLSETGDRLPVSNITERICSDGRVMNTANIGKSRQSFDGGTRVVIEAALAPEPEEPRPLPAAGPRIHVAAPKSESQIDKSESAVELLRAIFDLAEHKISGAELVAMTPPEHIDALYAKSRTAFEFIGFVFDAASKRQRGVA